MVEATSELEWRLSDVVFVLVLFVYYGYCDLIKVSLSAFVCASLRLSLTRGVQLCDVNGE